MRNVIINLQEFDTWKIQLTLAINFTPSKDVDEECAMHSKSNNIVSNDNANEIANELFEPLLARYQIGVESSMRGSDFIFDSVQLFHFKCHKINF